MIDYESVRVKDLLQAIEDLGEDVERKIIVKDNQIVMIMEGHRDHDWIDIGIIHKNIVSERDFIGCKTTRRLLRFGIDPDKILWLSRHIHTGCKDPQRWIGDREWTIPLEIEYGFELLRTMT